MLPWTVDWTPDAKEQLAAHWLIAADRKAVTVAADHIDQTLTHDPQESGVALPEDLWKLVVPPLIAYYEIDHAKRTVEVTGVVLIV